MRVDGKDYRTIWVADDNRSVNIIDQTLLPHEFSVVTLESPKDAATAIRDMLVRGAPLIGATGAYGLCLAIASDPSDAAITEAYDSLIQTRPTAINLRWALDRVRSAVGSVESQKRQQVAYGIAASICDEDVEICSSIGDHGLRLLEDLSAKKSGEVVNVLTHCNAGWLATVDWGTALAPIYKAFDAGLAVHVWVDETRPRNQGAHLTAWELAGHGVPHTLIVDNAGGHLMQRGLVDICIVGTDRTTGAGDVCNKIGTYLKALAAHDNGVPFYVAAPSPSIDWTIDDGIKDIPIEQRDPEEVFLLTGSDDAGKLAKVNILGSNTACRNDAFDVTPRRYVTGFITEAGICDASSAGLASLFPNLARVGAA